MEFIEQILGSEFELESKVFPGSGVKAVFSVVSRSSTEPENT